LLTLIFEREAKVQLKRTVFSKKKKKKKKKIFGKR
jgi:hypothetical protein